MEQKKIGKSKGKSKDEGKEKGMREKKEECKEKDEMPCMDSPHIDSTRFGEIVVNGNKYTHDIIILADGKIEKRPMPKGTHYICLSEIEKLLEKQPEVIVVGTGQSGVAEIEPEVEEILEKKKIMLYTFPTPEAIKVFNKVKKTKAGLFHLTC